VILSHKHQFIFFKPTKVGGTSVEVSLAQHCVEGDVVTNDAFDSSRYKDIARPQKGFYNHIDPASAKRRIPDDIWRTYRKITIIRNPWDLCVSRYWWEMSHVHAVDRVRSFGNFSLALDYLKNPHFSEDVIRSIRWKLHKPDAPNDFDLFIRLFPHVYTNTRFYLDDEGHDVSDTYLRFEHLDDDYRTLCKELDIPYEELPHLKTGIRKDKRHYSTMYTSQTRESVARIFSRDIDRFKYSFEYK
jgi:hypothetical protein